MQINGPHNSAAVPHAEQKQDTLQQNWPLHEPKQIPDQSRVRFNSCFSELKPLSSFLAFRHTLRNKHRHHFRSKDTLVRSHKNPGPVSLLSSPPHTVWENLQPRKDSDMLDKYGSRSQMKLTCTSSTRATPDV